MRAAAGLARCTLQWSAFDRSAAQITVNLQCSGPWPVCGRAGHYLVSWRASTSFWNAITGDKCNVTEVWRRDVLWAFSDSIQRVWRDENDVEVHSGGRREERAPGRREERAPGRGCWAALDWPEWW